MTTGKDPLDYVQGLRQWLTVLRALPKETRAEIIRELRTAVLPIITRARDLVHRSNKSKGAHLQDTIDVILQSARGILIGSRQGYGAILHFGRHATQRSRSGNTYTRSLTPNRWLYPAMAEEQDTVVARLGPAIDRAIELSLAAAGI